MALFASSAPRVPRPLAGHDDTALVQALGGSGGEAAFAEIYERYWYELYAAAYRKLGSPSWPKKWCTTCWPPCGSGAPSWPSST
ncbi:RNA polymerase sigma factor [Hymenobacter nivis]|uniref:RNA polymerase sigma factor n=1 Tax=Hymenobacter nivis TaxID=1850093 RepID=UPI0013A5366E|nr:hypothetical protein [Hymenobacter nivis]